MERDPELLQEATLGRKGPEGRRSPRTSVSCSSRVWVWQCRWLLGPQHRRAHTEAVAGSGAAVRGLEPADQHPSEVYLLGAGRAEGTCQGWELG